MANPNKAVAAYRNAKWTEVNRINLATRHWEVPAVVAEQKALYGKGYTVRRASYLLGPRNNATRQYEVRVYNRNLK
ncbi:MAG: hypothetical protein M3R16_03645 [Pseudomonadota bacterium]|nr:hypothetical protein [Pseudomonadota bacterium]